jgi:heme ABC exporter ATP-binding subunit CcmA
VGTSASLHDATVVLDDRVILREVSLEVGPGLTILRGPNGAGKTTLLRAIAGLVPLARGRRDVGAELLYIGHRPMLLRGLTARENLSFFDRFRGGRDDGVAEALRSWGLADRADRPVETLSAGERRRAALARLEVETVPVVLLDEPFADLDDLAASRLRETLTRASEDGRAVLLATHGHHELDEHSTRRAMLAGGELAP